MEAEDALDEKLETEKRVFASRRVNIRDITLRRDKREGTTSACVHGKPSVGRLAIGILYSKTIWRDNEHVLASVELQGSNLSRTQDVAKYVAFEGRLFVGGGGSTGDAVRIDKQRQRRW
jgi:hypothetical protein